MAKKELIEDMDKLLQALDFGAELKAREEASRQQIIELLRSFLEVMDSFHRLEAVANAEKLAEKRAKNWLKSYRKIGRQFEQVLRSAGVVSIACQGKTFVPGEHEIVETVIRDDVDEDIIVEEVVKGYSWNGEVIRRPKVIVARKSKPGKQYQMRKKK